MTAPVVLRENPAPGVALLRINRPESRNSLNIETRRQLARHLSEISNEDGVRCVVLTGNEKSFAAGADIKEMVDASTVDMIQRGVHKLWRAIYSCPKPVIAAVNGFALGGGCELAMTCDIIIAGEGAKFGQPEVKIGITPGGGGTQRLTRTIGKFQAMKYLLTGDIFGAKEALTMGLVSEIVPDAEVEKRAIAMATQIAELPPIAIELVKETVLKGLDASLDAGLALETRAIQITFATQDKKEGMTAFIEKRKPKFEGR